MCIHLSDISGSSRPDRTNITEMLTVQLLNSHQMLNFLLFFLLRVSLVCNLLNLDALQ